MEECVSCETSREGLTGMIGFSFTHGHAGPSIYILLYMNIPRTIYVCICQVGTSSITTEKYDQTTLLMDACVL